MVAGKAMKIRIKFRKYGVMKYVGHLDMMRYFQKSIRRAGLDICYSEGFHPHMIMSFALPLGVGLISDGEYLDIAVNSTDSSRASVDALNAQMADGVEILSYRALPDDAKNAMSIVAACDYLYLYNREADHPGAAVLRERLVQYYDTRESIPVEKKTKKSTRMVDLKPLIHQIRIVEEDAVCGFYLHLSAGSVENIKPELVLKDFFHYFGEDFDPFAFVRKRVDVYAERDGDFVPLDAFGLKIGD